jgi:hypothetical protein
MRTLQKYILVEYPECENYISEGIEIFHDVERRVWFVPYEEYTKMTKRKDYIYD